MSATANRAAFLRPPSRSGIRLSDEKFQKTNNSTTAPQKSTVLLRLCTHFCVLNLHRKDLSCGNSPSNNNESWRYWRKDSPSKAIAENLSIDVATVYWHLAAVRKIFGVHSNIELLHKLNEDINVDMSTIRLTPRGREVFELSMRGLSIKEISKRLGISYSGVLRHREKMLLVNQCSSMLELILKYHGTDTER